MTPSVRLTLSNTSRRTDAGQKFAICTAVTAAQRTARQVEPGHAHFIQGRLDHGGALGNGLEIRRLAQHPRTAMAGKVDRDHLPARGPASAGATFRQSAAHPPKLVQKHQGLTVSLDTGRGFARPDDR